MDLDLNLTLTDLQFYSKDFKFMKFYPVILLHMVCIVSDIYWGYAGICNNVHCIAIPKELYRSVLFMCIMFISTTEMSLRLQLREVRFDLDICGPC